MKKLLFCIAAALLAGCGDDVAKKSFAEGEQIVLRGPNASVTLQRTKGGWIDAAHPQNALLIDIFGTFCPPCQKEAPELFDLARKHSRLSLVALSYLEKASDAAVQRFSERFNAHYFISNDAANRALIEQILDDVGYLQAVQLPLKVLLQNGKYQPIGRNLWLLGSDMRTLNEAVQNALNSANSAQAN